MNKKNEVCVNSKDHDIKAIIIYYGSKYFAIIHHHEELQNEANKAVAKSTDSFENKFSFEIFAHEIRN